MNGKSFVVTLPVTAKLKDIRTELKEKGVENTNMLVFVYAGK